MYSKLIRYDIRQGFRYNSWKYAGALLMFLVLSLMFFAVVNMGQKHHDFTNGDLSVFDYLLYFMKGEKAYVPKWDTEFRIPALWMLFQLWLHFMLAAYPIQDIRSYGLQIFVRMEKRERWWLGKCAWNMATVVSYYGILFALAAVSGLMSGYSFTPVLNQDVTAWFYSYQTDPMILTPGRVWILLVILPVLVSLTLGLIQMALSLLAGPFFSFLAIVIYLYLATYKTAPYLIGNFSMAFRSNWLSREGADIAGLECVTSSQGIGICLALMIAAVLAGLVIIRRYELLEKA